MNWKYILHTTPFLILGIFLKLLLCGDCGGMPLDFLGIGLVIIYSILLIIQLIHSAYKFYSKKRKFNYYPVLFSMILFTYFYADYIVKENYTSNKSTLIEASNHNKHEPFRYGSITFFEKNKYVVILNYNHENGCRYFGKYIRTNDTLVMNSKIIEQSENFISSNKMIIDTLRGCLIPSNKFNDTTFWFRINKISR